MITARTANIERKTNETKISLSLNLDGTGKYNVKNPIGFLITCCVHFVNMDFLIYLVH